MYLGHASSSLLYFLEMQTCHNACETCFWRSVCGGRASPGILGDPHPRKFRRPSHPTAKGSGKRASLRRFLAQEPCQTSYLHVLRAQKARARKNVRFWDHSAKLPPTRPPFPPAYHSLYGRPDHPTADRTSEKRTTPQDERPLTKTVEGQAGERRRGRVLLLKSHDHRKP